MKKWYILKKKYEQMIFELLQILTNVGIMIISIVLEIPA